MPVSDGVLHACLPILGECVVKGCLSCGGSYAAPEDNWLCPLCGSSHVVETGEDPASFDRVEDMTAALLLTYLASSAVLAC